MNFLLNENIPPSLAGLLQNIGWNAKHVWDLELIGKPDHVIVDFAVQNDLIIITHDLDYGRIVSLSGEKKPSVITFRLDRISTSILFDLISTNRIQLEHYLQLGALLTIDSEKIRYRLLPIKKEKA